MDGPMNHDQEVLLYLCNSTDLLDARIVSRWTGLARTYVYGPMRGHRTIPMFVWNGILRNIGPMLHVDPLRFWSISSPIIALLFDNTVFSAIVVDLPQASRHLGDLCREAGILLRDMGALVESLAAVLHDGRVNAADDPTLDEFMAKRAALGHRLLTLEAQLKQTRAAAGKESP